MKCRKRGARTLENRVGQVVGVRHLSGAKRLFIPILARPPGRETLVRAAPAIVPALRATLFVKLAVPTRVAIEEILLLDECSVETDWSSGVLYLPLR